MPQDDRPQGADREVWTSHDFAIIYTNYGSGHPDLQRYPYGGEAPRNPAEAGYVGKRRQVSGAFPDPAGNRAERRAADRAGHKRIYGGKGGTHRAGKHRRR